MRSVHLKDNLSLNYGDKHTKLRPLILLLKSRFMKPFVTSQNISHDEPMVEYFGRHRFNFEPYQGSYNVDETSMFGNCAATVLRLIN
ncbi:hypothetical protein A3Q56_08534, partial [Intoshia linei]